MIWVVFGFVFLILMTSYICYRIAFDTRDRKQVDLFQIPDSEQLHPYRDLVLSSIHETAEIPYEEVWIDSEDGLRLFGKYYQTAEGAPLQILFHGYRSVAEWDFCIGLKEALSSGFNVLLVDQRAHGKSDGKCLTFGVKERKDCMNWVNYSVQRFGPDTKILLYGLSMGASTVLMASELSLPENVVGIVADCGYSSPSEIIRIFMKKHGYPALLYPFCRFGGMLFGGFDLESASATEALEHCSLPVLFIHGEDDRFVPCEMGRSNYSVCSSPQKQILTVPGAGHGLSCLVDPEKYLETVHLFESKVLDRFE